MIIGKIILGTIAIVSITVIACSARGAMQSKEKCEQYLRSIRDRTKQ